MLYIMQIISVKVRELLGVEELFWNRSITLPHASQLGLFLERKSFTGARSERLQLQPHTAEHTLRTT